MYLAKTQFVQRFLNDDEKEDEDAPDLLYAIPEVDLKGKTIIMPICISFADVFNCLLLTSTN